MNLLALAYVAVGGAVGAMCRYLITSAMARTTTVEFPLGTLTVNVLGGFLLGLWIAVVATYLPNRAKDLHLLFAVGALGGFTTFSAFSMDVFLLMERGLILQTVLYILGSVILSVVALLAGMWCIKLAVG